MQKEDILQSVLFIVLKSIKNDEVAIDDNELRRVLAENKCPDDYIELAIAQIKECVSIDLFMAREDDIFAAQSKIYDLSV